MNSTKHPQSHVNQHISKVFNYKFMCQYILPIHSMKQGFFQVHPLVMFFPMFIMVLAYLSSISIQFPFPAEFVKIVTIPLRFGRHVSKFNLYACTFIRSIQGFVNMGGFSSNFLLFCQKFNLQKLNYHEKYYILEIKFQPILGGNHRSQLFML